MIYTIRMWFLLYMWVNIQYGHLSCIKKSFNSVFEGNVIIWQYQEIQQEKYRRKYSINIYVMKIYDDIWNVAC